jgi:sugar lactone lactonase YvrE
MRRIAVAVGLLMLMGAPAAGAVTPEYFRFPAGYLISNFGVTTDGAGDVWFTAQGPAHVRPENPGQSQPTPTLARLVVSQAAAGTANGLSFYPTPDPADVNCCANQVRGVAYSAHDDKLYYVRDDGGLGSLTPSQAVAGTSQGMVGSTLPGNVDLWDVAASPTGGAWFTEHSASNLAPYYGSRLAFSNGGTTEGPNVSIQNGNTAINDLRYDAQPAGVAVAADGRPWFVEENPGNPGYRLATWSGAGTSYDEYQVSPCEAASPCSGFYSGSGLTDVAVAPDGGVWFTNSVNKKLGRFDPVTHTMVQYSTASIDPSLAAGGPRQITAAPDGTLWMTTYGGYGSSANAIVRIVPTATPTATVYKTSTTLAPLGIGADRSGNVWFGLGGSTGDPQIGRLAGVVGTVAPPPPAPPAPAAVGAVAAPVPVVPTPPPGTTKLAPASTAVATITPPQTGNGAINTNQRCVGPPERPCTVVYLIKEHEYVTAFPSAVGAAKKKKAKKPRVLGTKTVTLHGGQTAKVTVKLNTLGKRILKGKHKLKVVFTATQKLPSGKTKLLTNKTLTLRSR